MTDGFQHTFAQVAPLITIAKFQRFAGAGRCAGGCIGRTDFAGLKGHFGHHGRITARIHDLKGLHIGDIRHVVKLRKC